MEVPRLASPGGMSKLRQAIEPPRHLEGRSAGGREEPPAPIFERHQSHKENRHGLVEKDFYRGRCRRGGDFFPLVNLLREHSIHRREAQKDYGRSPSLTRMKKQKTITIS